MSAMTFTPRTATADEKDALIRVNRELYERYPELRRTLMDPLKRNGLHNILLSLMTAAPEHTLSQCIVRVAKEGYTVTVATGVELRAPGKTRGSDAKDPVAIMPGSQRSRLLAAYWDAGEAGLTSQEARDVSKVSPKSCYWKRVSELHAGGYLEVVEDEDGNELRREADTGGKQRVYRITPLGQERAEELV